MLDPRPRFAVPLRSVRSAWLLTMMVGVSPACGDDDPSSRDGGSRDAAAFVDADRPRDAAADRAVPGYRCDGPSTPEDAPEAGRPLFVEVTEELGLGTETYGFGRVRVVDIDGDGYDDIVGLPHHNGSYDDRRRPFDKLVLRNVAGERFHDVTAESGLAESRSGLVVFADVDNDGDQDLFGGTIEGAGLEDRGIWINDGEGHFRHQGSDGMPLESLACGDHTCVPREIGATFVDIDGDGWLDLYTGGWFWADGETLMRYNPPPRDRLYMGVGDGRFEDRSASLPEHDHPLSGIPGRFGRAAMGVSAGDYDNDGDMDVFVANYGAGRPALELRGELTCQPPRYWDQNLLWRNDDGTLVNVAEEAGVHATMRGPSGIAMEPMLVIGDECPEAVRGAYESPIGGNSFTSELADFDNDGDLDLVVGSIAHPDYLQSDPTTLFVNQGPPDYRFVEEATARGLRYREDEKHVHFVDVDMDGRLDLVTTGLRNPAENELRVYLQTAGHRFELASAARTGVADSRQESVAWLDFDHDGDLDLYLAEDASTAKLFRNVGADPRHRLVVRLRGGAPADATGARVTLETAAGRQLREVTSGNGHYNMQRTRALAFGLGGDRCARELRVRWPDGEVLEVGDVAGDQDLTIRRDGSIVGVPLAGR